MKTKNVRIRESHRDFIEDHGYKLSKLVRNAIEDAQSGERGYPTGNTRRSTDEELIRTTVLIDEEQDTWLEQNDANFAKFVDDVIGERIEYERRLNDLKDR